MPNTRVHRNENNWILKIENTKSKACRKLSKEWKSRWGKKKLNESRLFLVLAKQKNEWQKLRANICSVYSLLKTNSNTLAHRNTSMIQKLAQNENSKIKKQEEFLKCSPFTSHTDLFGYRAISSFYATIAFAMITKNIFSKLQRESKNEKKLCSFDTCTWICFYLHMFGCKCVSLEYPDSFEPDIHADELTELTIHFILHGINPQCTICTFFIILYFVLVSSFQCGKKIGFSFVFWNTYFLCSQRHHQISYKWL